MDTAEIANDILRAKAMHPDILIAFPPWGIEYVLQPNQQQNGNQHNNHKKFNKFNRHNQNNNEQPTISVEEVREIQEEKTQVKTENTTKPAETNATETVQQEKTSEKKPAAKKQRKTPL